MFNGPLTDRQMTEAAVKVFFKAKYRLFHRTLSTNKQSFGATNGFGFCHRTRPPPHCKKVRKRQEMVGTLKIT
jgi:hypothetical protein